MLNISDFANAQRVFYYFEEISKIPHTSEHTEKIADWLVDFAKARGLDYYRDASNNVVIRKSATKGYEGHPGVIFQGHTDMVAAKTEDCEKDLVTDAIDIYRDGDFIRAKGTTLGGDDGIGVAYALAVLEADDIPHPDFEAVFTSDEEIGLLGAVALAPDAIKGRMMINLDSDCEGTFTAGCAGGLRIDLKIESKKTEPMPEDRFYKVTVSDLLGGHSGGEIHKGRANAIKILAEIVAHLNNVKIVSVSGGNADNAIARYAECIFSTTGNTPKFVNEALAPAVIQKWNAAEPNMKIVCEAYPERVPTIPMLDSARILRLLMRVPYGVVNMSRDMPGLVETSANPGVISTDNEGANLTVSIRSSKGAEKEALRQSIYALGNELGAVVSERGSYPAWEYRKDSPLRDVMCKVYRDMYSKDAKVEVIHAGLECGIFSDKLEGLDCVSTGPDGYDIHTPAESLSIPSVARVWEYLKRVLAEL